MAEPPLEPGGSASGAEEGAWRPSARAIWVRVLLLLVWALIVAVAADHVGDWAHGRAERRAESPEVCDPFDFGCTLTPEEQSAVGRGVVVVVGVFVVALGIIDWNLEREERTGRDGTRRADTNEDGSSA